MAKPKHILVIRLSAMGDVAMTVPVLRAISEQHPDVELTVLTKPFFKPIFSTLHNVNIITADTEGTHKGLVGLMKLAKQIKSLGIDAVADLHNVLRSKILKRLLFVKPFIQIDKGRTEKKALISGKTFAQLKSTHERYADVFRALGISVNLNSPKFPKPSALDSNISDLIGSDKDQLIGIAPFAAFEGKAYPLHKMETVISKLAQSGYNILLFGSGGYEANQLQKISEGFNEVCNVAGKLSFEEELALISNLRLMVSMDSGNAHLAAMFGVKVVTIWGVTHPYAGFYPFHQDLSNAILADRVQFPKIPTSVYGNTYPEGYDQVFKTITPEMVIEKIESLL